MSKEYRYKYYIEHKEEEDKRNKKWRDNNREKFIKSCNDSRKRRVERLRAEGCTNAWSVVVKGAEPKYY